MAAAGFYFGRPLQSSLPKAMQQMYCLVIPHSVAAGIAIFKLRSFTSSLDQGPCVCRVALEDRIRRWSLYRVSKGTQVRKLHYVIDYVPASKRATCASGSSHRRNPKKEATFLEERRKISVLISIGDILCVAKQLGRNLASCQMIRLIAWACWYPYTVQYCLPFPRTQGSNQFWPLKWLILAGEK